MHKKTFLFDTPTKDILTKLPKTSIHFFAKTLDGIALAVNDIQAEYFAGISANVFIGQNYFHFFPEAEAKILTQNDTIAINSNIPYLVRETCLGREAFSIKAQLKDSCNHTIGVGGIAFYSHQTAFKDIIAMTNELTFLHPDTNKLKYNYISNTRKYNMLSRREKECVYYLTRGMTYKEIGRVLSISSRTVEIHIGHIKNKLGCYNRSDIISKVFETN